MGYVKLDECIMSSSLWDDLDGTRVFVTALLMAKPRRVGEPMAGIAVRSMEETGFVVPAGDYGWIEASGVGLVHQSRLEREAGLAALERLCGPDVDSKDTDWEGRRLARVRGGYVVLNFEKYREKDHTAAERKRRQRARERGMENGELGRVNGKGVEASAGPVSRFSGGAGEPPALHRGVDEGGMSRRDGVTVTGQSVTVTQAEAEAEAEADRIADTDDPPGGTRGEAARRAASSGRSGSADSDRSVRGGACLEAPAGPGGPGGQRGQGGRGGRGDGPGLAGAGAPVATGQAGSLTSLAPSAGDSPAGRGCPTLVADRKALWKRLKRCVLRPRGAGDDGRDPPSYLGWWQENTGVVAELEGGLALIAEVVRYCEDCADPAVRRAKDLGVLEAPPRFVASRFRNFLKRHGRKLSGPPGGSGE